MSSTRVKITGSLEKAIKVPQRVWSRIGMMVRENISKRTRAGVDADGATFEGYSEGYLKQKKKAGGASGSRVNLKSVKAGGHMMTDMVVVTHASGSIKATVKFASAAKATIAQYHMGEGRVDREFFAVSDEDQEAARAMVLAAMGED